MGSARRSSTDARGERPLDRALKAYEHFDERDDGWTEVVLHPAGKVV